MKIEIKNKGQRNELICHRENGTLVKSNLGPNVPYHDIAHFVVESSLKLKDGFYGNISKGYSVAELSDKEIIKTLPVESMVAEIITRALQSLYSGATELNQLADLVELEFRAQSIQYTLNLTDEDILQLLSEYELLIQKWDETAEGGSIVFNFRID